MHKMFKKVAGLFHKIVDKVHKGKHGKDEADYGKDAARHVADETIWQNDNARQVESADALERHAVRQVESADALERHAVRQVENADVLKQHVAKRLGKRSVMRPGNKSINKPKDNSINELGKSAQQDGIDWGYDEYLAQHGDMLTPDKIAEVKDFIDGRADINAEENIGYQNNDIVKAFKDYTLQDVYDENGTLRTAYYTVINRVLRGLEGGDVLKTRDKEVRNILHAVLSQASYNVGDGAELYRGTSIRSLGNLEGIGKDKNQRFLLMGQTITEKGFMSTSIKPSVAKDFIGTKTETYGDKLILRIHMRGGEHAMGLKGVSEYSAEEEILFDEGQEFLIMGIMNQEDKDELGIPEKVLALDVMPKK